MNLVELWGFISSGNKEQFFCNHNRISFTNESDYKPQRFASILLDDTEKKTRFKKVVTTICL